MAENTQANAAEDDMPTVSSEVEGQLATQEQVDAALPDIHGREMPAEFYENMPLGLRVFFDDRLYERCKRMAGVMSRSVGIVQPHLIGKPELCFGITTISLTANMNPFWVSQLCFQTPNGQLGFYGRLIQAIMEQSGRFKGDFEPEWLPDEKAWEKIQGKWKWGKSARGKDIPVADWKPEDENGLGVIIKNVSAQTGKEIRFKFMMKQAVNRNSTLWPTDPMTQLWFAGIRRFSSVAQPSALMGLPIVDGEWSPPPMREVNPEDRPAPHETKQATNGAGETVVEPEPEKKEPEKKEAKKPSLDDQIDKAKTIDAEEKKTEGARPKFRYRDQIMVAGSIKKHALKDIQQAKEFSDLAELQGPLKELVQQLEDSERLDVAAEIKDAFAAKQEELSAPEAQSQEPEQDDFGDFGE